MNSVDRRRQRAARSTAIPAVSAIAVVASFAGCASIGPAPEDTARSYAAVVQDGDEATCQATRYIARDEAYADRGCEGTAGGGGPWVREPPFDEGQGGGGFSLAPPE